MPAASAVPLRVKIVTLGRFEILVDGKRMRFGRKAPARPLMLLKYLAAHGGAASDGEAARTLWPRGGTAALRSLAVNVHRLRRLLAAPGSLVHHDRRLAIDPRHVWCDAPAFERLLEHASQTCREEERLRLTERALSLYGGDFLAHEDATPWITAARERLRVRFVRAIALHAYRLADGGRWQEARAWYERGLEIDGLAEELCLGLMTCLAALRLPVDAIAAYRRFERSLSVRPGLAPAGTTQTLYRQLLLMQPTPNL